MKTFRDLFSSSISEPILNELSSMGVTHPTEVQEKAFSAILSGKNSLVLSPTGSGKTLAYVTPLIELTCRERAELRPSRPTSLIVVPNRELCLQVLLETKRLAKAVGKVRVEALVGGSQHKRKTSRDVVGEMVDVLVATPGLFLKMRDDRKVLFSSDIRRVVFDEADTLFGKGFVEDMKQLLIPIHGMGDKRGEPRQMIAVAATMPTIVGKRVEREAFRQQDFVRVSASRLHQVPSSLRQDWVRVNGADKMPHLQDALMSNKWTKCLVFVNSPDCARAVEYFLRERGYNNVASFHSELPAGLREQSMKDLRSSQSPFIVVSSDAASRGIDVADLDLVINYDFPPSVMDYLHRVGRTARMGRTGKSVSLIHTKRDRAIALEIQKIQQDGVGDLTIAMEQSNFASQT